MTEPQAADVDRVPTAHASAVFGSRLGVAERFWGMLASDGVAHGHLGPREVPRLWSRHLINSALVADLVPVGSTVTDVGSGAGLPGLPMAIRRPDLRLTLVEPMAKRVRFLEACVHDLGLGGQVDVCRGRAEDAAVLRTVGASRWVVARAVAPLDRLVGWCLPLLGPDGRLLAMKGDSAEVEVREHGRALAAKGVGVVDIVELGTGSESARVVVIGRLPGRGGATLRRKVVT